MVDGGSAGAVGFVFSVSEKGRADLLDALVCFYPPFGCLSQPNASCPRVCGP